MNDVLVRALIATLVAVVGGVVAVVAGAGKKQRIDTLVAVASGALLAVTLLSLLPEAAEHLRASELILSVLSGYVVFYVVGRYLYPVCPACASSHLDNHEPAPLPLRHTAVLLAVALTLHSIMDGVAVAAGGDHHGQAAGASLPLLVAVSLHKLPEGLALAALLLGAGYKRSFVLLATTSVELTTLVGGLLGTALMGATSPRGQGVLLAHIAGSFLYLVFHTLQGPKKPGAQIGYGTLGFGSVALLLWSLSRL